MIAYYWSIDWGKHFWSNNKGGLIFGYWEFGAEFAMFYGVKVFLEFYLCFTNSFGISQVGFSIGNVSGVSKVWLGGSNSRGIGEVRLGCCNCFTVSKIWFGGSYFWGIGQIRLSSSNVSSVGKVWLSGSNIGSICKKRCIGNNIWLSFSHGIRISHVWLSSGK